MRLTANIHSQKENCHGTFGTSEFKIRWAGSGEVFKLTPSGSGWIYTHLYDFNGDNNNGEAPTGGVIFDANGNLYGTTYGGGEYGDGIVWELTP